MQRLPHSSEFWRLDSVRPASGFQRLADDELLLRLLMKMVPKGEHERIENPAAGVVRLLSEMPPTKLLGTIEICIALLVSRSTSSDAAAEA